MQCGWRTSIRNPCPTPLPSRSTLLMRIFLIRSRLILHPGRNCYRPGGERRHAERRPRLTRAWVRIGRKGWRRCPPLQVLPGHKKGQPDCRNYKCDGLFLSILIAGLKLSATLCAGGFQPGSKKNPSQQSCEQRTSDEHQRASPARVNRLR